MFVRTENFREFLSLYPVVSIISAFHLLLYVGLKLQVVPETTVFDLFAGTNMFIADGEYWRLVTPIFIHFGFSHMLFNTFSLVLFGPALERALGKTAFLIAYLASGIGANIASFALKPPYFSHIGASGAIFGLFGIYLAIMLFQRGAMPREGMQVILPMAAIGMIMTFFQPNVNTTGHLFGLISGFLIGLLLCKTRTIRFF